VACRGGGVTVAHLLTHTAGLPGSRQFYRWCRSGADLLRDLGQTALGQPPGTGVAYSDPGFILLGEVVAAVAGEPLDAAVRRLVGQRRRRRGPGGPAPGRGHLPDRGPRRAARLRLGLSR